MNTESVREDIGYMDYKLDRADTFKGRADKIKIEYIAGLMKGKITTLRRDIAEDLIKRRYAREVERA
jgi:hypothetical protein